MIRRLETLPAGVVASLASTAVRTLVGIVSVPIALMYLGKTRYGLWMTAQVVLTVFTFLDGGLFPVLKNRLTTAVAAGNEGDASLIRAVSLAVSTGILALGLVVVTIVGLVDWSPLANIPEAALRKEFSRAVFVLSCIGVLTVALGVVDVLYASEQRLAYVRITDAVAVGVGLCLLVVGTQISASLPGLVMLVALPAVGGKIILLISWLKCGGWPRRLPAPFVARECRAAFGASSSFLGLKAAEIAIAATPATVLALTTDPESVATYSVLQRLCSLPLVTITAVLPVFWARFAAEAALGRKRWLRRTLGQAELATATAVLAWAIALLVAGPALVGMWTHGRVVASGATLLVLTLGILPQAMAYWPSTYLHAVSEFLFEFRWHAALACAQWLLALALCRQFNVIGMGAAAGIAWLSCGFLPMKARVASRLGRGHTGAEPERVDGE